MTLRKNIFLVALVIFLTAPAISSAAVLSISPAAIDVTQGDTVTVSVRLDTQDQAVNAVQTTVRFPSDKLKLISAVPGSIFSLMTPNSPFIDTGKVSFSAGAVSPGFTGKSGTVMTLKFSAQTTGAAAITFDSSKVLLNDGSGTDALNNSIGATISIAEQKVVPVVEPVVETPETSETPVVTETSNSKLPEVTSISTPDQNNWYSTHNISLLWTRPEKAYGFSFNLDQKPNGEPNDSLDTTVTTNKTYTSIEDGTWYFHIKSRGASANSPFSQIATFRVNLDTVAPSQPTINLIANIGAKGDYGFVTNFASQDQISGIANYKVLVDDLLVSTTASTSVVLGPIKTGTHKITVTAVDKAGNESSSSVYAFVPDQNTQGGSTQNSNLIVVLLVENAILLVFVGVLMYFAIKHHDQHHHKRNKR